MNELMHEDLFCFSLENGTGSRKISSHALPQIKTLSNDFVQFPS